MRYEVLPAREVMRRWRPGSYEPPWSWADEEADIEARTPGRLEQLRRSLIRNGFDEPVLLGDDGRVWDGHHRIIAAARAGLDIPVEIINRLDHAHPDAA